MRRPLRYVFDRSGPKLIFQEALLRLGKKWNKKRFAGAAKNGTLAASACKLRFVPLYDPKLEWISSETRSAILAAADLVLAGHYPLLSYGTLDLGLEPDWTKDFISGKSWPLAPSSKIVTVRHDGSDIKAPWELSRMQFLLVLAKAFRLTGERKYRSRIWGILRHWRKSNPLDHGPNWAIAMESAIRGITLCQVYALLHPLASEESAEAEMLAQTLYEHLRYTEAHSEFSYFIRSNHYLSNIVGAHCIASFLDGPGMQSRRERYLRLVQEEIQVQTYSDGADWESSTGYQILVTQLFFTTWVVALKDRQSLDAAFSDRLGAMFRFIADVGGPELRMPHLGDCDDGRTEWMCDDIRQMQSPLAQRDALRVSGMVGMGALFGVAGGSSDDVAWYGSTALHAPPAIDVLLPDGGIAVLRKGATTVYFSAIPNGIAGRGSHTHNDKLSVVIRKNAEDVFIDSGTGVYTRKGATRNAFRSTAAHSTVMVDSLEQNSIPAETNGLFCSGNEAQVTKIVAEEIDGLRGVAASHFGFQQRAGVVHRRFVALAESGDVIVRDCFEASGVHQYDLFLVLAPGVQAEVEEGNRVRISGKSAATVEWEGAEIICEVVPADFSTIYGHPQPTSKIHVQWRNEGSCALTSKIRWQ